MPKLREDEKNAKDLFDKYLQEEIKIENPQWDVNIPQDPPDCMLTIGSDVFAVEITTIAEKIETPRGTVTRKGIDEPAKRIVAEVQDEAIAKGILNGTYTVQFPIVDIDFYGFRNQIKKELLDFIRATQTDKNAAKTIRIEYQDRCEIKKTSASGSRVSMPFTPISTKWEGEIQEDSCKLINERITEKAIKMKHIREPKILIMISENDFIAMENYNDCITELKDIAFFHTVFVCFVRKDEFVKDQILYSVNSDWMP